MNDSRLPVIIVGAGIAGLTAAWRLKQAGIKTLVLEAENTVGGRMRTLQVDDALIDCGAQFLSSAYTIIPQLITETKLTDEYVETSEWVGLIREKGIALVHPQKPLRLVFNRILSICDLLKLGFNQYKLFKLQKKLSPLNNITDWLKYDNELASDWIIKHFGERVARELTSVIFNGFYFQSLNHSSAALAAPVVAFSAYHPKTMTLLSGMESLPQKLAEQLSIKKNTRVTSIETTPSHVKVISDAGEFAAEHVIVTTPAPIAKTLIKQPDLQVKVLLETQYSSTIVISLLVDNKWTLPHHLTSAYGFLVNPQLKTNIAALTIENNKCHTRRKQGMLINVMLNDVSAKSFMNLSDEEIYPEIRDEIEKILPAISSHLELKKLSSWKYAMPYTPIGRASAVSHYRKTRSDTNRIWLAGDYLGLPWTDSAAETGEWAAGQIVERFKTVT